jgi:hypothetical protein
VVCQLFSASSLERCRKRVIVIVFVGETLSSAPAAQKWLTPPGAVIRSAPGKKIN